MGWKGHAHIPHPQTRPLSFSLHTDSPHKAGEECENMRILKCCIWVTHKNPPSRLGPRVKFISWSKGIMWYKRCRLNTLLQIKSFNRNPLQPFNSFTELNSHLLTERGRGGGAGSGGEGVCDWTEKRIDKNVTGVY